MESGENLLKIKRVMAMPMNGTPNEIASPKASITV